MIATAVEHEGPKGDDVRRVVGEQQPRPRDDESGGTKRRQHPGDAPTQCATGAVRGNPDEQPHRRATRGREAPTGDARVPSEDLRLGQCSDHASSDRYDGGDLGNSRPRRRAERQRQQGRDHGHLEGRDLGDGAGDVLSRRQPTEPQLSPDENQQGHERQAGEHPPGPRPRALVEHDAAREPDDRPAGQQCQRVTRDRVVARHGPGHAGTRNEADGGKQDLEGDAPFGDALVGPRLRHT